MLADVVCKAVKAGSRVRKLSDGEGLQLWVQPNGRRFWRLAYRYAGKQKVLALGQYPTVSLADAREARYLARKLLAAGVDPSQDRRNRKAAQAASTPFGDIADEFIALQEKNNRAEVTIKKTTWLLDMAKSTLGHRPISEIRPAEVLEVLKKVEARGCFETARRMRSTIGGVFRLAVATDRARHDPTQTLRGALANPKVTSHAAITDAEGFGSLLRAVDGFDGQPTTVAALKLMALLFPRPGELRFAEQHEFDLKEKVWTIPAHRTKLRREHKMPLPRQAVKILEDLISIQAKGKYLFASIRTAEKPISENTLNAALRRLGYAQNEATSHGFRASASTLLNESGKWHPDAIERQLAHVEKNAVRRVYARGEHWDERVAMLQWWADHLDVLRSGDKVVQLRVAV